MKRSRLFSGILFLMVLIMMLAAGCGKTGAGEEEKSLTIKADKLLVGTHVGYAPMEYYEKDGTTLTGFDMELAGMLADYMGLELEVVPCAWDAIFHRLDEGSFDVVISSVSFTKERNEKYFLTKPYLKNGLVLVVPQKSRAVSIASLAGGCVGVQLDTTADQLVKSYVKAGNDIEPAQYENVLNALEAMERGDVDGVVTDSVVADFYLVNHSGYKIVWSSDEEEPFCICMDREKEKLQEKIEDALKALEQHGKLKELSKKYFGKE